MLWASNYLKTAGSLGAARQMRLQASPTLAGQTMAGDLQRKRQALVEHKDVTKALNTARTSMLGSSDIMPSHALVHSTPGTYTRAAPLGGIAARPPQVGAVA